MNNIEKRYFGCTDPYGNDDPADIFYKNILPLLKKNNVNNEDIKAITDGIIEMCEMSYGNGMASEAFDRADYE